MAYKMACAETGADCPFEVVTKTKEEMMEHVAIHARMSHPELAKTPPSPEMIEKLIHTV
jgi:predicted small metal-binding protein